MRSWSKNVRYAGRTDLEPLLCWRVIPLLPFEFLVDGTPVSLQTKNKRRLAGWKSSVEQAARAAWPPNTPPIASEVTVRITYFYEDEAPDVDNIIKPIQDALRGLVYVDDSTVTLTQGKKSRIDGAFVVKGVSEALAIKLARGRDFVRVVISAGPSHEDLR